MAASQSALGSCESSSVAPLEGICCSSGTSLDGWPGCCMMHRDACCVPLEIKKALKPFLTVL